MHALLASSLVFIQQTMPCASIVIVDICITFVFYEGGHSKISVTRMAFMKEKPSFYTNF